MRINYEQQVQEYDRREGDKPPLKLESHITPSLPGDTPVLKLPSNTVILIQEDRIDSGGVADLYEGTVATLSASLPLIEKAAPTWLADVLLKNTVPLKEIAKVSFVLEPYQNLLPSIASDGQSRLNANKMLRARKILGYVADRIETVAMQTAEGEKVRVEDYLELWCQDKVCRANRRSDCQRTFTNKVIAHPTNNDSSYNPRPCLARWRRCNALLQS
jgi:WD repeat-containing protein 48